ncbi:hypothetical protein LCGC14_0817580 [marine sediment metagenome]|uniref:Uncharacterized protein n=1 Tax=marine sediment metagenome TaxID=412755 RepID=A0A0F9Q563_9ZZZZ
MTLGQTHGKNCDSINAEYLGIEDFAHGPKRIEVEFANERYDEGRIAAFRDVLKMIEEEEYGMCDGRIRVCSASILVDKIEAMLDV